MAQPECSLRLYLHVLRAMSHQLPVMENEDNVMQKRVYQGLVSYTNEGTISGKTVLSLDKGDTLNVSY